MSRLSEGTVPFFVDGEEFHTYYKVHGSLTSPQRPPLIVIHGGPGFTHDYLGPLADIALHNDVQAVILYDQLGNGKSSRLVGKPINFFSVKLYVDELANLIDRLQLEEYHIYGHSWGGPLAAEFEVEVQPPGLKSLIISNSLADMATAGRSSAERIETLDNVDEVKYGFQVRWDDPKALRASYTALHKRYGVKYMKEIPKELRVLDTLFGDEQTGEGGDPTVSQSMTCTRTWTIVDRLHRTRVPVLLITGADDFLQDYCSAPYFWRVDKVRWIKFEKSSHVPFWEEREKYMGVIGSWLNDVGTQQEN